MGIALMLAMTGCNPFAPPAPPPWAGSPLELAANAPGPANVAPYNAWGANQGAIWQIVTEEMAGTNLWCWLHIIYRESHFQPWAENPLSHARGLTQMLPQAAGYYVQTGGDPRNWRDVRTHLRAARRMYDARGFSPWGGC